MIWISLRSFGLLVSELPHHGNSPDYRPGNSPPEIYMGWEIDVLITLSSRGCFKCPSYDRCCNVNRIWAYIVCGNYGDIGSCLNHNQLPYMVDVKIDVVKPTLGCTAFNVLIWWN